MRRGVIFDIDGTLIDSVDAHAHAWHRAFAHFGYDIDFAAVRAQIGKGGDQLMPVFLSDDELERFGKQLDDFRADLFKREYLPGLQAFPQVRGLFERVAAEGLKIALASSAKGDELETYKQKAHIGDLLSAETSSDDVERSKPHPDIFAAALEKIGLPEPEVMVVGDSPYDADAAGKLGLVTIGLLCGGFAEADLRRAGCVAIYEDPADLLAHYRDSPLAGG